MPSPFDDDAVARKALEAIRWPNGPRCPHCDASGTDVFEIGGEKKTHREGLYQCKPNRHQFTVTVGTSLERQRIPLSTWIRAAHVFSYEGPARDRHTPPPLIELETEIGVSYKTVLRMRDIIKHAAEQYRGYKAGFGLWPRSLMKHRTDFGGTVYYRSRKQKLLEKGKHPSQHAINSSGVLERFMPDGTKTETRAALGRTERLLRLLLGTPKPSKKRKSQSTQRRVGGHGSPSSP